MPKIGIIIYWIILIIVWIFSGIMMFYSKFDNRLIKNRDKQKIERIGMFFFFICGTIVFVSIRSGSDD